MGWEQSHIPVLSCGMIYFLFYATLKKLVFLNHPWRFYARTFLIPPLLTYSLLSYSSIAPIHAFVYSPYFTPGMRSTIHCSILPFLYLYCTYWSLHCKYFRTTMSCNSLLANVVCFTCTTLNKALSSLIFSYLIFYILHTFLSYVSHFHCVKRLFGPCPQKMDNGFDVQISWNVMIKK